MFGKNRGPKRTMRGLRKTVLVRGAVALAAGVVAIGLIGASAAPAAEAGGSHSNFLGSWELASWWQPFHAAGEHASHSHRTHSQPKHHSKPRHHRRVSPSPRPTPTSSPTASPSPTATATPTPRPTPTPTPTPRPTSTPTPTSTQPPTSGSPGEVYGWQLTAANTGLAAVGLTCSSLPLYTGSTEVPAGTTISRVRIAKQLDLSAGNITVEDSCIQPTPGSVGQGSPVVTTSNIGTGALVQSTVTLKDNDCDGSLLAPSAAAFNTFFWGVGNLIGNYVHGFGGGIAMYVTGTKLNATVQGNYVTGLVGYGDPTGSGNHVDAFTIRDFDASKTPGRELVVKDNRFDVGDVNATGALFIQAYSGPIDNVSISGNLLEGDGYQLGLEQLNYPYNNVTATNNRFSGTGWGAAYVTGGPGWAGWSSNYYNAPGKPGNEGAVVAVP